LSNLPLDNCRFDRLIKTDLSSSSLATARSIGKTSATIGRLLTVEFIEKTLEISLWTDSAKIRRRRSFRCRLAFSKTSNLGLLEKWSVKIFDASETVFWATKATSSVSKIEKTFDSSDRSVNIRLLISSEDEMASRLRRAFATSDFDWNR
jgi:hypothetical protein